MFSVISFLVAGLLADELLEHVLPSVPARLSGRELAGANPRLISLADGIDVVQHVDGLTLGALRHGSDRTPHLTRGPNP